MAYVKYKYSRTLGLQYISCYVALILGLLTIRAGTNTPSDEYDTYREYRVANTIRIATTLFLRG